MFILVRSSCSGGLLHFHIHGIVNLALYANKQIGADEVGVVCAPDLD
jgi:hypothetical protein